MKKLLKKVLSAVLAVSVLAAVPAFPPFRNRAAAEGTDNVGNSPVTITYADGEVEDWDGKERKKLEKDCTVVVNDDFDAERAIVVEGNVTALLKGGNHTVTVIKSGTPLGGPPGFLFEVNEGGNLTVENLKVLNETDLTINGVLNPSFVSVLGKMRFINTNFTVKNGTVISVKGKAAELTFEGGKISNKTGGYSIIYNDNAVSKFMDTEITVSDGNSSPINNRGGTVDLINCTLNNTKSILNERGTLNINGGKLISQENSDAVFNTGGIVNIYDGEVKGISNTYFNNSPEYSGTLNIFGGSVLCGTASYDKYSVINYSEVNIKGGTVTAVTNQSYGTVNISGGKVMAKSGESTAINNLEYSSVNIGGGEVLSEFYESSDESCIDNYGEVIISGGTIKYIYTGNNEDVYDANYAISNYSGAKLEFDNALLESSSGVLYNENDAVAEVKGGSILSGGNMLAVYNSGIFVNSGGNITSDKLLWNTEDASASIEGGDNVSKTGYCIYNYGDLYVSGGKIISENMTYCIRNYGIAGISGGTVGAGESLNARYIVNFEGGVLGMSGAPVLQNTSIWLRSDDNIVIEGELKNTEPYTVYIDGSVPRIITDGWSRHMEDVAPSNCFKSPYGFSKIAYSDSEDEAIMRYFSVTFEPNGGTCSVHSSNVSTDGKITLPEPTRDTYNFDGWFTEKHGGEKVTDETVYADDATIYAQWTPNAHHVHDWSDVYSKNETHHWLICKMCGEYGDKKDYAEHTRDAEEVIKEPSCTETGEIRYTCVCGHTETEVLDLKEHNFGTDWRHNDTEHWQECDLCGFESNKSTHDWKLINEIAPTEEKEGQKTFKCSVCEAEKTEITDKLEPEKTTSSESSATVSEKPSGTPSEEPSDTPSEEPSDVPSEEPSNTPTEEPSGTPSEETSETPYDTPKVSSDMGFFIPDITTSEKNSQNAEEVVSSSAAEASSDKEGHLSGAYADSTNPETASPENTSSLIDTTRPVPTEENPEEYLDYENIGNVSKWSRTGLNAPAASLATPLSELKEMVLNKEETMMMEDGVNIRIILTVDDATDSVPEQDKAKVESIINTIPDCKLGQYLDIRLLKIIGSREEKISETDGLITVTFEVPETLRGKGRKYSVIRIHNGESSVLEDLDDNDATVTIKTDRFSTYALTVTENTQENPKTGVFLIGIIGIFPAAVSAGAVTIFRKKRGNAGKNK